MIDVDAAVIGAIQDAIRKGISDRLGSQYSSPLTKAIDDAVAVNQSEIQGLLSKAIKDCLDDDLFCKNVRDAARERLAKVLVQKFGGEIERRVNELKSDPTTRARIVLMLEEIVDKKS